MKLHILLLFIPACFALNMAFGPNNLLSLTVGARQGMRDAVLSGFVRLVAFAGMIAIAGFGMGAILMASAALFTAVKFAGAAYLFWIGIRLILSREAPQSGPVEIKPLRDLLRQEFLVAAGNPKAILIFTAFFPQFVQPSAYWQSFVLLGGIFLVLETAAIAIYAFLGARLKGVVRSSRAMRRINQVSGSVMMGFGLLLAFARQPAT